MHDTHNEQECEMLVWPCSYLKDTTSQATSIRRLDLYMVEIPLHAKDKMTIV